MPRTVAALVLAIGALAGRIDAQGNGSDVDADSPFPCVLGDPCEEDPTFLALGTFPCSGPTGAVCSDPLALDACSVSDML